MSGAAPAETEATRARPLSGGLWSLISWLRRDDSGASSDSLSSVGSDRTVASFAFLSPDRYGHPAAPILLPPPGPPTDSYKKRVRDRNSRLQRDRDLTLHRKYGLFGGDSNGYDAFSLPPVRKFSSGNNDWEERERRATSECLQRRAAHVPGKRRAPPPPGRSSTLGAPRRSRKRPAPQPPRRALSESSRNATIPEEPVLTQISTDLDQHHQPLQKTEAMDCKPEKYIKKETKDSKPRIEKNFLKQIFESRKRNSAVYSIPERILPSISELDKQATEIIESCKLKALDRNERTAGASRELVTPSRGDMWFCTRCLRKYDDSVVTCGHCVTEQKMRLNKIPSDNDRRLANRASNHYTQIEGENVASTSGANEAEDKQKLKEMLKEIKDSLPKRPKHDANVKENNNSNNSTTTNHLTKLPVVEAPTLRIGSTSSGENKTAIQRPDSKPINAEGKPDSKLIKVVANSTTASATEMALVTQPIVLQHVPARDIIKLEYFKIPEAKQEGTHIQPPNVSNKRNESFSPSVSSKESNIPIGKHMCNDTPLKSSNGPLNTPLKISTLLNSNPLPEMQLTRDRQKINQRASTIEAKPLVSQEERTQKPLKSNTTTQTSNTLLDIAVKSKQNATNIKDLPSNHAFKTSPPNDSERDPERKNAPYKISTTSPQSSLLGVQPGTISLLQNPRVDNKEAKVESKRNQKMKLHSQNAPSVISGVVQKLDVPRAFDHHQRNAATKIVPFDQHSRRRDLISQLEQSIAKGDERAAADAAAKLAQLRLSCSVLSFSSQIVGAQSAPASARAENINESTSGKIHMEDSITTTDKLEIQIDSSDISQNTSKNYVASASKTPSEKKTVPTQSQSGDVENKSKPTSNEHQTLSEPSTSKQNDAAGNDIVSIEVWIEDREAARGPIRMNMPKVSVMADLRRQANTSFGLAAHLQRWIVGKTLCTDDNTPLDALAGPQFDAPFYLCLVEPETNKQAASRLASASSNKTENKNQNIQNVNQTNEKKKTTDVYAELVLLERRALVPNADEFECGVCIENCDAGQGAVLRECMHTFCKQCLSDVVKHSEEPVVSCPAMGCPGFLQEREIRALVSPEDYERWLARGLAAAESGTRNAFHCRTHDCHGWALCEPGVTRFPCPVCKRSNCVLCQVIHEGDTCEEYRAKQRASETADSASEKTDEGTRAFLDTLISRGEALECPECSAIITKKWGCDWIKCSACKTEICWVTRGRRWGPGGRGDTSAGCRCGVDGKRLQGINAGSAPQPAKLH